MALVPFRDPRASAERSIFDREGGLLGGVSILDRLDDVRKRLVRVLIAVCAGTLIAFTFIERIVAFLLRPAERALPAGNRLIYTEPGEAFGLYIQVALIVGVVFALPYVMYQLWRIIAPIVGPSVKRFAVPFVLMSTVGFVAGAAFNHYVVFAWMMTFFASFNTPDLIFMPKLDDVFDLYTKMLLGMGAVFQMPTIVFFLSKIGLVTARMLWRSFRYAILVIFIVAAVITPTGDMVTQTIFAAPMVGLYILSIGIAWLVGKPRRVDREAESTEPGD